MARRLTALIFVTGILHFAISMPRHVANKDTLNDGHDIFNEENRIKADKLVPADHLDAVRMEQDGHINTDFHKEAFIGDHEEIDEEPGPVAEEKLKEIFQKVDANKDGLLDLEELEKWILRKIQEHYEQSVNENKHIFNHLDTKKLGYIDWKEYYKHFMLAKGYDEKTAQRHVVEYDQELKPEEMDAITRYKFRWTDADEDNNNKLTELEFLAFRHPEHSNRSFIAMIDTIITSLDKNEDEMLSKDEFIALPPGEAADEETKKLDKEWQKERLIEFEKVIDVNKDGVASKEELLKYVDPRNPEQAKLEAKSLLDMIDDDKDSKLTIKEVLENKEIFISSKIVDVKRVLHDEF